MDTLHPAARAWLDRVHDLAGDVGSVARRELVADLADHLGQALPAGATDEQARTVLARLGDPADVVAEALHVAPATIGAPPSGARPTAPPPPPAPSLGAERSTSVPNGWEVTSLTLLVLSGLLLFFFAMMGAEIAWVAFGLPVALIAMVIVTTRSRWTALERLAALAIPLTFALGIGLAIALPLDGGRAPEFACSEFEVDGRFVQECNDGNGRPVDGEGYPVGRGGPPPWTGWLVAGTLLTPPVASAGIIVVLVRRLRRRVLAPEQQAAPA